MFARSFCVGQHRAFAGWSDRQIFQTLSESYEGMATWQIVKVARAAQAADRAEVRGIQAVSEKVAVAANKGGQAAARAVGKVGRVVVSRVVAGRVDQEAAKRVAVREVQGEARVGRVVEVGKAGREARNVRTVPDAAVGVCGPPRPRPDP